MPPRCIACFLVTERPCDVYFKKYHPKIFKKFYQQSLWFQSETVPTYFVILYGHIIIIQLFLLYF